MDFNNVRITIKRFDDLTNIEHATFDKWAQSRKRPTHVAIATNAAGTTVLMVPVEQCLLIDQYLLNPVITRSEATQLIPICTQLEAEIVTRAAQCVIQKVVMACAPEIAPLIPNGECRVAGLVECPVTPIVGIYEQLDIASIKIVVH